MSPTGKKLSGPNPSSYLMLTSASCLDTFPMEYMKAVIVTSYRVGNPCMHGLLRTLFLLIENKQFLMNIIIDRW